MLKAREVYKDCEYAKEQLQQALDQERLEDAKLYWFAALAMLRAIGHVLHKVDENEQGEKFREKLKENFELWKQEPIFNDFIEKERNNILKEYKSSLTERTIEEENFLLLEGGGRLLTASGEPLITHITTITTLVKEHGEYSGTSPTEALSIALAWWNKRLSELEQIS